MATPGYLRRAVVAAGIVLMNLPVAILVTWLALPFWKWLDVIVGTESYGHSGPAEWCYWAVFFLLNLMVLLFWLIKRGAPRNSRQK